MSDPVVFLNGNFLPVTEAKVSVLDRGFMFGDGVYEVIPAYGRKLFRLKQHLDRLQNSLDAMRIKNPMSDEQWENVLLKIIEENEGEDQSLYLEITRGVAKRDHAFPEKSNPTVFVMSNPLKANDVADLQNGVNAVTLADVRWQWCYIKSVNLLANVLLRQQAVDHGASEAILLRDGCVTEGAASNVFIVKGNVIQTPPKSEQILPGITRDLVVEVARNNHITCEEVPLSEAMLRDADEIWLTSSTREILPVVKLDGKKVGDGVAGPIWSKVISLYQDYKSTLRN